MAHPQVIPTHDGVMEIYVASDGTHLFERSERSQHLSFIIRPTEDAVAQINHLAGHDSMPQGLAVLNARAEEYAQALAAVLRKKFGHYGQDAQIDCLHALAQEREALPKRAMQWMQQVTGQSTEIHPQGGFDVQVDPLFKCKTPDGTCQVRVLVSLDSRISAGSSDGDRVTELSRLKHEYPNFADDVIRTVRRFSFRQDDRAQSAGTLRAAEEGRRVERHLARSHGYASRAHTI